MRCPSKKFGGTILRIAPVVDSSSGTFRVTTQFHDKSGLLKPGMFARIDIVYDHREDALTIPRSALIEEDGETAVFVVEKSTAAVDATKNATAKTRHEEWQQNRYQDRDDRAASPTTLVAHRQVW